MLAWIAETTLVASVLALVASLVGRSERLGPSTRHALWLVVLLKLLTPPLVAWPRPAWLQPAPAPASVPVAAGPVAGRVAVPTPADVAVAAAPEPEAIDGGLGAGPGPVPDDLDLPTLADRSGPELAPEPAPATAFELAAMEVTPIPLWPGSLGPRAEPDEGPARSWSAWVPDAARLRAGALGLWGLGALGWVLVQGRQIARFGARVRRSQPAPGWVHAELEALAPKLGVTPPPVAALAGLESPLLWCAGRARLLVPTLAAAADRPGWRGVLAHELAHLRRGDPWVSRLTLVAGALWWWNPLYWLVRSRLEAEAELACDAWAVWADPQGRRSYAETLIEVGAGRARSTAPAPALGLGGGEPVRFFERRLTMIVRNPLASEPPRGRWLAAGLLGLVALPAWSTGQEDPKPARPVDGDRPARVEGKTPEARDIQAALAEVRRELPAALAELKRELPIAAPLLARLGEAGAEVSGQIDRARNEVAVSLDEAAAGIARLDPDGATVVTVDAQGLPADGSLLALTVAPADDDDDDAEDGQPLEGELKTKFEATQARLREAQARMQARQQEMQNRQKQLGDEMRKRVAELQAEMARNEKRLAEQMHDAAKEMEDAVRQRAELLKDLRIKGFKVPAGEATKLHSYTIKGQPAAVADQPVQQSESRTITVRREDDGSTTTERQETINGKTIKRIERNDASGKLLSSSTQEVDAAPNVIVLDGKTSLFNEPVRVEGQPLEPRTIEGQPLRIEGRVVRPGKPRSAESIRDMPVPPVPPVPPAPPVPPRVNRASPVAREPLDPKVLEVLKSGGLIMESETKLNQRVDRLEQKFDTLLEELRSMRKDLKANDKP